MTRREVCAAGLAIAASLLAGTKVRADEPARAPRPASSVASSASPPTPPAAAVVTLDRTHRESLSLTSGHEAPVSARSSEQYVGAAMVREVRAITLPVGKHTLRFADIPDSAPAGSLLVSVEGARLLSQRLQENVVSVAGTEALLKGAEVLAPVRATRGGGKQPSAARGALVGLADGVVLKVGGELSVVPSTTLAAPTLPPRALLLEVEVPASGRVAVDVSMLAPRFLQHAPAYTLQLDEAGREAALSGQQLFTNLTGLSLDGARASMVGSSASVRGWASLEQRASAPMRDPAPTWGAASMAALPSPFLIEAPLRFDETGVASASLVEHRGARVDHVVRAELWPSHLLEPELRHERLPIEHLFGIDTSKAKLASSLPPGPTTVSLARPAGAPPLLLSRGWLWQQAPSVVQVRAPETYINVLYERKALNRSRECVGRAVMVYHVPASLLSMADFEVTFRGDKRKLSVKARGASDARVLVDDWHATVRLPRRPDARGTADVSLEVTVSLKGCD